MEKTETAELFDRALDFGDVKIVERGAQAFAAVPKNRDLKSIKSLLDEYATKPDRRIGTDKVTDLASLGAWINRHKDAGSVVFCDRTRTAPKLLSVVDYHQEGEGDAQARFGKFRALYEFPLDKRWKDWSGIDGKVLDQAEFAAFLEDHVLDLIGPDVSTDGAGNETRRLPPSVAQYLALMGGRCAQPNDVVALSRGLDVTANNKVSNKVDLQSGEGGIVFESSHTDGNGQRVDVPRLFMIAIPIFERADEHYRIPVRIRYRLRDGSVKWIPTLFGADDIIDAAIKDAADKVAQDTSLPLFYGWPSS